MLMKYAEWRALGTKKTQLTSRNDPSLYSWIQDLDCKLDGVTLSSVQVCALPSAFYQGQIMA